MRIFLKSTDKSIYLRKCACPILDRHFDPKMAKIAFFVFYFFPDRTRASAKFPKFSARMQSKMWHLPKSAKMGPPKIWALWRRNGGFFIKTSSKLDFRQVWVKKVVTPTHRGCQKSGQIHVFFWQVILNHIFYEARETDGKIGLPSGVCNHYFKNRKKLDF